MCNITLVAVPSLCYRSQINVLFNHKKPQILNFTIWVKCLILAPLRGDHCISLKSETHFQSLFFYFFTQFHTISSQTASYKWWKRVTMWCSSHTNNKPKAADRFSPIKGLNNSTLDMSLKTLKTFLSSCDWDETLTLKDEFDVLSGLALVWFDSFWKESWYQLQGRMSYNVVV